MKPLDGKQIEMLPGTCSNPEPPASIKELPLGPLDLAWYMLAAAEISSGQDVGIAKSLRSKLKDGPILFMEAMLRIQRITMDVLNSDSAGFARHLLDYLAGMEYLRKQDKATFNALSPPRGEIPQLLGTDLIEPMVVGMAEDSVVAFGIAAALPGWTTTAFDAEGRARLWRHRAVKSLPASTRAKRSIEVASISRSETSSHVYPVTFQSLL